MSLPAVFTKKLAMGVWGEEQVFPWLLSNGYTVEDCRRQNYKDGGGPRMISNDVSLALPDFIVYKGPVAFAIDVKVKSSTYPLDGPCFTVDKKFEDYLKVTTLRRLDYLAMIFIYNNRFYMYKDSDVAGVTQYNNEHSQGNVYYFKYDKTKVVK